jgi:hypothetical protein
MPAAFLWLAPFECLRRLKVSGFKVQSSMATPFLKKRNVMLDLFQHLIPLFCLWV